MSIMSRYGGACRAKGNLLPLGVLGFTSVVASWLPGTRQTHGRVSMLSSTKKQILPLLCAIHGRTGVVPQPHPKFPLCEDSQGGEIQNRLKGIQRRSSARAAGRNRSNESAEAVHKSSGRA